jgi:hypothetical protein
MNDATKAASDLASAKLAVTAAVRFARKHKAEHLNYSFAGEADLIASLRPAMLSHGLSVAPIGVTVLEQGRYQTLKGGLLNHVVAAVTYCLTHAPSGESEDCQVPGEASDVGDKAAPKALIGAYKYFLRQTFLIEMGDDPDRYASADQEAAPASKPAAVKNAHPPRTLAERLAAFDARLVAAALAQPEEATEHVTKSARVAHFPQDMDTWNEAQVSFAIASAKGFEAMRSQAQAKAYEPSAGQTRATTRAGALARDNAPTWSLVCRLRRQTGIPQPPGQFQGPTTRLDAGIAESFCVWRPGQPVPERRDVGKRGQVPRPTPCSSLQSFSSTGPLKRCASHSRNGTP